jgi:hypothetical protein
MKQNEWLIFWLIGLLAVGVWLGSHFFSREARLERRRRKSHSPIISRATRRTVRLSVRPPRKKNKKE